MQLPAFQTGSVACCQGLSRCWERGGCVQSPAFQTGSVACCQEKVQALGKGEGVCSHLHFESLVSC